MTIPGPVRAVWILLRRRDEIAPPPFPQEGEDIVISEQAFGQVVLVAKKLAAMVSINNELLKMVSKSSPWNEQRQPSDRAVEPTHPILTPPKAARQRHRVPRRARTRPRIRSASPNVFSHSLNSAVLGSKPASWQDCANDSGSEAGVISP